MHRKYLPEEDMEFEQLVKRLEWLDEEHRKTRSSTHHT